jgi:hypothetical protein
MMGEIVAVDRHHNGPPDAERIELAKLPAPKGRGRPSLYTPGTVDRLCDRLADGESLKAICRDPGTPCERAVLEWAATRPEFRQQYDFAREVGREAIGHDVLAIADGLFRSPGEIKEARRKIDALKWHMAGWLPSDAATWLQGINLNANTAKAFGFRLPASLLALADRVIE